MDIKSMVASINLYNQKKIDYKAMCKLTNEFFMQWQENVENDIVDFTTEAMPLIKKIMDKNAGTHNGYTSPSFNAWRYNTDTRYTGKAYNNDIGQVILNLYTKMLSIKAGI